MAYEALTYPMFQPAMRIVTAITNGYPALVTTGSISYPAGILTLTSFNHQYANGMIIRLLVPSIFGMNQVNKQYGTITVVNASQFTIDIDTTFYDPFVVPQVRLEPSPPYPAGIYAPPVRLLSDGSFALEEYAQSIPFAEENDMLTAAVRNVLPYP